MRGVVVGGTVALGSDVGTLDVVVLEVVVLVAVAGVLVSVTVVVGVMVSVACTVTAGDWPCCPSPSVRPAIAMGAPSATHPTTTHAPQLRCFLGCAG